MLEEKEQEQHTLTDEFGEEEWGLLMEVGEEEWGLLMEMREAGFLERDFFIDIDEIEIEFVGPVPRLTGRIEMNLEAPLHSR